MHLQFLNIFIDDFMENIPSLRPVESFDPSDSRYSVVICDTLKCLPLTLIKFHNTEN